MHVLGSGLGSLRPAYPFTPQLSRVTTNVGPCQDLLSLRGRGAEPKSPRESPRSPRQNNHSMPGHPLGDTCVTEAAVSRWLGFAPRAGYPLHLQRWRACCPGSNGGAERMEVWHRGGSSRRAQPAGDPSKRKAVTAPPVWQARPGVCSPLQSPSVSPARAAPTCSVAARSHPGRYSRGHRRTPGAHPSPTLPRRPARPARKHTRPGCCHPGAARCAPDSPARRLGRVSGRQVSPSETGFLGAPRCPTFLPGIRLPLPLPSLSVLLAAPAAPPPGLRHAARGPGAEGRPRLSAAAAPPPPAAPVPERGAFLIGGHTLRGRREASLNSSPPAPAALRPPPTRPGPGGP